MREDATLADLKALLAGGIPVEVVPATTPHAHRLYLTPRLCGQFKPVQFAQPHPTSGALGEMISLAAVEELRAGSCGVGLNDSVILAAKLLVGYDDERQLLIMHDPSLGPGLELGYEEFGRMWRTTEARYWAAHPAVPPAVPPGRVDAVRARTPDDEAAVALFRACGLEVIGEYPEAERVLRAARAANADFDGYAIGHRVLAHVLACSGERAANKEAKRELKRAQALCGAEAQRRVADELGRDFHVMGCKQEMLGWSRP